MKQKVLDASKGMLDYCWSQLATVKVRKLRFFVTQEAERSKKSFDEWQNCFNGCTKLIEISPKVDAIAASAKVDVDVVVVASAVVILFAKNS